jgi:pimeloyl-ACP methyl ester carboxylesterase
VILIPGLHLHPFSDSSVPRASFASWQRPGSPVVKALSLDADVFAFTYGQSVAVSEIAALPALCGSVRRLREAGYSDIVLVGFSAGGLVARQFVEDGPDAGVTKVVQVCAPNGGSSWAELKVSVRVSQRPFLESLTKEARLRWLAERRDRAVPTGVQFVCVIGTGLGSGDGLVSTRSAWPEDLQRQGIPAVTLRAQHLSAVRGEEGAKLIAELVRQDQPRWDAAQVDAMRRRLWGVSVVGH